jgi:LPXTG-site transpeptidase (sortase) family protein
MPMESPPATASPAPAVSLAVPTAIATPTASPPRLIIPALALDRPVVTVPIRAGNWDLNGLDDNVGWLETTGQKPGEALAMAFVGHITLTATRRGPFADLWKLPVGAEIIYRLGATDYIYGVKYKVNASPDEAWRLYVQDGQTLLLVTCTEWDYTTFSYAKRLIVVAEAANQTTTP